MGVCVLVARVVFTWANADSVDARRCSSCLDRTRLLGSKKTAPYSGHDRDAGTPRGRCGLCPANPNRRPHKPQPPQPGMKCSGVLKQVSRDNRETGRAG